MKTKNKHTPEDEINVSNGIDNANAKDVPSENSNGKGNANAKDVPSGNSKLLEFDLPPVSEQGAGFIDADKETDENQQTDTVEGFAENSEAEKHRGALDDKGQAYDPLLHCYPPEKTGKFGKWKKLPKKQTQQKAVDSVKSNASYRGEAQKYAQLFAQLHMIPFGDAGALKNKDDLIPLIDDLERYMLENGHSEISAGWSVLLSSSLYSVSVCQREPNKVKLKKWFGGYWSSIKKLFGVKSEKKAEDKQGA